MGLRSILFVIIFSNIDCLIQFNKNECGNILQKQAKDYAYEKAYKSFENQKSNILLNGIKAFFIGVKEAGIENIKNIAKSLFYPVESIIRLFNFSKKVIFGLFDFFLHPKTDDEYIDIMKNKLKQFSAFFNQMCLNEKLKWIGYVISDFIVSYFTPFGLAWKLIFFVKNVVKPYKSIKVIEKFKKISKIDSKVAKIIDKSSSESILNIKYGFEYVDQFRQYLNDFALRESC